MTIDIPRKDENGNILFTVTANEEQVQALLQFALNFLMASGLTATFGIMIPEGDESDIPEQLND